MTNSLTNTNNILQPRSDQKAVVGGQFIHNSLPDQKQKHLDLKLSSESVRVRSETC